VHVGRTFGRTIGKRRAADLVGLEPNYPHLPSIRRCIGRYWTRGRRDLSRLANREAIWPAPMLQTIVRTPFPAGAQAFVKSGRLSEPMGPLACNAWRRYLGYYVAQTGHVNHSLKIGPDNRSRKITDTPSAKGVDTTRRFHTETMSVLPHPRHANANVPTYPIGEGS
jgi:hypothetical protein